MHLVDILCKQIPDALTNSRKLSKLSATTYRSNCFVGKKPSKCLWCKYCDQLIRKMADSWQGTLGVGSWFFTCSEVAIEFLQPNWLAIFTNASDLVQISSGDRPSWLKFFVIFLSPCKDATSVRTPEAVWRMYLIQCRQITDVRICPMTWKNWSYLMHNVWTNGTIIDSSHAKYTSGFVSLANVLKCKRPADWCSEKLATSDDLVSCWSLFNLMIVNIWLNFLRFEAIAGVEDKVFGRHAQVHGALQPRWSSATWFIMVLSGVL